MVNIVERSCVICRTKKLQRELFRFVIENGEITFDKNGKTLGRGFYICSKKCWEEGVKKRKKVKISSRENRFVAIPDVAPEGIVW